MRVLIVDDSMLIRSMLRKLLESFGYDIVGEEGNGENAVDGLAPVYPIPGRQLAARAAGAGRG